MHRAHGSPTYGKAGYAANRPVIDDQMTRLPSLTSLRLLSEAVRHSSLSRAADVLGLTQSAASRRIASLEADIGTTLLDRHRRGVAPTADGKEFLAEVEPAIRQIAASAEMFQRRSKQAPLRLRVYSTPAGRWLMPRLHDFEARHPDIRIRLDTTVSPVSFDRDDVDLAIQYGDGRWADMDCDLIIADASLPVCAPAYAAKSGLDADTAALAGITLLHSHYRRSDWADWASFARVSTAGAVHSEFPSSLLAYQAAIEGLGVVIAQRQFVDKELADGSLVTPWPQLLARDAGYYLVTPRRPQARRAQIFRRWIVSQAGKPGSLPAR